MSIDIYCVCDECKITMSSGEETICIDCFVKVQNELKDCEDDNAGLVKDIEGYREDIAALQDELREKEEELTDKDMELREWRKK